jgi:hypothetical protein
LCGFFQLPQYYPITTKKFWYDIKIETQRARAARSRQDQQNLANIAEKM